MGCIFVLVFNPVTCIYLAEKYSPGILQRTAERLTPTINSLTQQQEIIHGKRLKRIEHNQTYWKDYWRSVNDYDKFIGRQNKLIHDIEMQNLLRIRYIS